MKSILIGMILLSSLTAFSQSIEINAGFNKNNFFDLQQDNDHYISSYKSDYGYAIRIAIEDIKIEWMKLRLTLGFDKYIGGFNASDGGLAGSYSTNGKVDKSVISLGVFPLNFKILERIDLNFGVEFSRLLNDKVMGTNSGSIMNKPYWNDDLNEKYDRFSSNKYSGLRGRIAYDFKLSDKVSISPQYSYYYGLSKEFLEFPETTQSMRHYFAIGIQKRIK